MGADGHGIPFCEWKGESGVHRAVQVLVLWAPEAHEVSLGDFMHVAAHIKVCQPRQSHQLQPNSKILSCGAHHLCQGHQIQKSVELVSSCEQ